MKKNIRHLVTGGAGFIGSAIVKKLLERGDEVFVIDNLSTGRVKNIEEFKDNKKFKFFKADIRDAKKMENIIKNVDYVFHEAAVTSVAGSFLSPIDFFQINVIGTLNIIKAAKERKIKKIVFASSCSVYGQNNKVLSEQMLPSPISPYALTKYVGESIFQIFSKSYGVPAVCLRYFNVFGPKQDIYSEYSAVVPKFVSVILSGSRPNVFGDGKQTRDFVYVDDVARANIKAAFSKYKNGEVFNVASGRSINLLKLTEIINKAVSQKIKPVFQKTKPGNVRHSRADISKIEKFLAFIPETGIDEGLANTIEWIKHEIY